MNTDEADEAADRLVEVLRGLDPERRLEVMSRISDAFCHHCGNLQPREGRSCQCWNDD